MYHGFSDGTKENLDANSKLMVASIDIGTTYSGYAFSFSNQHDSIDCPLWRAELSQLVTEKNPTSVLFHNDEFDSVGYEAEEKYVKLVEKEEDEGWFLFSNFKMKLYKHVNIFV